MNIFSDILVIKDAPNECDVVRSAAPIHYSNVIYINVELFKYIYMMLKIIIIISIESYYFIFVVYYPTLIWLT